jgi:fumarylpyruvate hydrolase
MALKFVIEPPALPSLPVVGSAERFPVRRVYCVGRNYADHAREMGADPTREPPFFFTKPADAVFAASEGAPGFAPGQVPYPPLTHDLQYEIELVVAIGGEARGVSPEEAMGSVWGYGVGVDLTRRDLQNVAKELRRPWDLSKGFDASGPCSAILPISSTGHPHAGAIWLSVDGQERQRGDLADQIWPVADVIAELSSSVALRPGDLIFTGTPAGVGPIGRGSHVIGGIDGVAQLDFVLV